MDGIFPYVKDFQFLRPIRSQTPVLILSIPLRFTQDKLVEGLYPLSYGCEIKNIIRRGNFSQFLGAITRSFQKPGLFLTFLNQRQQVSGAVWVQLGWIFWKQWKQWTKVTQPSGNNGRNAPLVKEKLFLV